MMEKCIVMIPATSTSKYFVPAIVARGYRPVIIDPFFEDQESEYRTFFMSDQSFYKPYDPIFLTNKHDIQELIEELKAYDIAAIIAGSDVGVELTDQLNTLMGMKGNSSATTYKRRDKLAQQDALKAAGIRFIRSQEIRSMEEALAFYEELGQKSVVIKPLSGGGSEGVHICNTRTELTDCVAAELNKINVYGIRNETLLIQECIKGKEYVVNTASCKGRHILTDMWFYEKIKMGDEGNAYDYMKLVVDMEPGDRELVQYTFQVLDAVDYQYGPCHTELMVDENGPVLIEVNPRLSGGDPPRELALECFGYTAIDCVLDAYLDEEKFIEFGNSGYRPLKHAMYKMLISPKTAKTDVIPAVELFKVLSSVKQQSFERVLKSHQIEKTINVTSSPASAWLIHEDERVLLRDYRVIHYLEFKCFDLLFEEQPSFSVQEKEAMDRALANLQETIHFMPDALYIVDDDFVGNLPDSYVKMKLEEVAPEKLPEQISGVVYHCGTRFESLEELFKKFSMLKDRLVPGGSFIVSPWGASSVPYGVKGIECVLTAMGLKLEMPRDASRKIMQKIVWATRR